MADDAKVAKQLELSDACGWAFSKSDAGEWKIGAQLVIVGRFYPATMD
ncbi:hypothetical protein [Pseudorhodoplanes sp.]